MRSTGVARGFATSMQKIAAPAGASKGRNQQMTTPTTPLQIENEALQEQIDNIQLKLQLRQMMAAQDALAQAEAQPQEADQGGGAPGPQFPPAPMRQGRPNGPMTPQDMVGG